MPKYNIIVKCNNVNLNDADWTYDATTGELVIAASAVTDNITIYAKAVDARVNVTFTNGGNTTFTGEDKVIKGTAYTCTIVPDTGYTLGEGNITVKCNNVDVGYENWTYDAATGKLEIAASAVTGNITIYAKAVEKNIPVVTYTVSFAANGGSGTMADVTGISGEYTLPANGFTAPDGKQFKAWSVGGVEKAVGDKITVTANTTVTAVWENIPVTNYTITATAGANGTISPSGEVSVAEGEDKTFTITANSGYHIKDVKVNGASVGAVATYTFNDVAANATITVEFEVDTVPHVCNPTLVPKVEPNCTTAGKSAYYHCECGKNYEDAQGNSVISNLETWGILNALGHEAQDVWSTDADNHWHKCTRCEEQLDKAAHSGGTATCTEKAVCATCNIAYGNTVAHSHGSEWHNNADEHWNECECGDKANVAPHADANNDGKCDTCEYAMGNAENLGENIESEKTGLSGGAIAGIVIGSVAGAAALGCGGFAIFWFVIKKKKFADLIALFKKKQ